MKKNNLFLFGYFGFNNFGDEAILYSFINNLNKINRKFNYYILAHGFRPYSTQNINYVDRNNPNSIIKAINKCDFVVSPGGGIFQDVTSLKSLIYYTSIVFLSHAMRKPVILLSQGIGPLKHKISKILLQHAFRKCVLITLRDNYSFELVSNLTLNNKKYEITTDTSYAIDIEELISASQADNQKNDLTVGIAPRYFKNKLNPIFIGKVANFIIEKYNGKVHLFSMFPSEDYEFNKNVKEFSRECEIINCKNFEESIIKIHKINLMVGIRLHSIIFSALCGIPSLAICYDKKVEYAARKLEQKYVNTDKLQLEIFTLLEEIINNIELEKNKIVPRVSEERLLCKSNFELLFNVIGTN